MAGKGELQKLISFRLNTVREDEKELYETIMGHNRGKKDDSYGSSGAYIKAALKAYHRNEQQVNNHQQIRDDIEEYLCRLANEQRELFLQALDRHDQRMATLIVEAVVGAFAGRNLIYEKTDNSASNSVKEETMPEEALAYLQSL